MSLGVPGMQELDFKLLLFSSSSTVFSVEELGGGGGGGGGGGKRAMKREKWKEREFKEKFSLTLLGHNMFQGC